MPEKALNEEQDAADARARVERMVERYLSGGRYLLNPDPVTVEHVKVGLARNLLRHGCWYCPCREVVGDPARDRVNICPCPQHHEDIARDGVCECGIFVSREFAGAQAAKGDSGAYSSREKEA
jgi:ferredoxin-thioredoxin reductase catalytic chain